MIRTAVVAGMAVATACAAFGQSAATQLKFEVASIKPVAPSLDGRYTVRDRSGPGVRVSLDGSTPVRLFAGHDGLDAASPLVTDHDIWLLGTDLGETGLDFVGTHTGVYRVAGAGPARQCGRGGAHRRRVRRLRTGGGVVPIGRLDG